MAGPSLAALEAKLDEIRIPADWETLQGFRKVFQITTQQLLREALRCKLAQRGKSARERKTIGTLDMVVPPIKQMGAKHERQQICLTTEEMIAAYNRRRQHMLGQREILSWAKMRAEEKIRAGCDKNSDFETPLRAVAFWHIMPGRPNQMPAEQRDGLSTAANQPGRQGFLVDLYTYQADSIAEATHFKTPHPYRAFWLR